MRFLSSGFIRKPELSKQISVLAAGFLFLLLSHERQADEAGDPDA
jgi:hypothetical protein